MKPRAIIFDAYGTLFDVHSVVRRVPGISGDLPALSLLWRQKQVEYTWRRTLMKRYADFWQVTGEALRSAVHQLRIHVPEEARSSLMEAYLSPEVFADVRTGLDALKQFPLAILSNGSWAMLDAAVRANGLEPYFTHVISVDEIKTYKPSPEVYELGARALGKLAEKILFVSSNGWDAAGAKAFGYRVCWCNRSGEAVDCFGFDPDFTVSRLDQISNVLE
jgi:2-haloacid dehalogenase